MRPVLSEARTAIERLGSGQPVGAILQMAYTVADLAAAARQFADRLRVGPFFVFEHFPLVEPKYRGQPTNVDLSIAIGFSGAVCIELIQQHNDVPSVYRETTSGERCGFHHWATTTRDFDAEVARYQSAGYAIAFEGAVAVGGRFAYADARAGLGGMVELIELTPKVDDFFAGLEQAARHWNGSDPVRVVTP